MPVSDKLEVKVPITIKNVHMRTTFKLGVLFSKTSIPFSIRNEFNEYVKHHDNPLDIMIVFNRGKNGVIVSFEEGSDTFLREQFLRELMDILNTE